MNYRSFVIGCVAVALTLGTLTSQVAAQTTEYRPVYVDAFTSDFYSSSGINNIVSRAVAGRYNMIVPEVLAYHDRTSSTSHGALWNSTVVPKANNLGSFDPLGDLVTKAHNNGIKVYAWIVPFRACSTWPPAYNTTLSAHPEYVMVPLANMGGGPALTDTAYMLDPGSPGVQEYVISIVRELVTNYAIDGIMWDYIRYVQSDTGYPAYTSYTDSGLERFKRITGYVGTPPATGETSWDNFRRREVTEIVRRARAEIAAITTNPQQPVANAAALITQGGAPSTFSSTNAWARFQNWEEWMRVGFLDVGMPMNYDEDAVPQEYTWYRQWIDQELLWRYYRHMVPIQAAYMNPPDDSKAQMLYARNAGANGVGTYHYANTRNDGGDKWAWYPYVASNVFTTAAAIPTMTWRYSATATEGTIWGRVTDGAGIGLDDAQVGVPRSSYIAKTDPNGYYVITMINAAAGGTTLTFQGSKTGYPTISHSGTITRGGLTRLDFTLATTGNPPAITVQPASQTLTEGSTATFTVTATGDAPLAYQWMKDGVNLTNGGRISGATTNSLQITSLVFGDAGNYQCYISNTYGNITSDAATLTVNPAPFIVESRSGGLNYAKYSIGGTWTNSTTKSLAPGVTAGIGSQYASTYRSVVGEKHAYFKLNLTTAGYYEVFATWGSGSNRRSPILHRITHAGGVTDVNIDQNATANAWVSLGTYLFNAGTDVGQVDVNNLNCDISGNMWADAVKWVYVSPAPPTITQHPTAQTVCSGSTAQFTVAANGAGTLTYQWQKNSLNLTEGGHYLGVNTPTLDVSPATSSDAGNYRCVVTNAGGSTNSNTALLTIRAQTVVTLQPVSQSVCRTTTAVFTTAATGDGTLTYQWQKNGANLSDGGKYSGVTTTSLTITNVLNGEVGTYQCIITGGCGSTTSNQASLGLKNVTSISQHPSAANLCAGGSAQFKVTATGDGTLTYQWQKNGGNLSDGGHYSGALTSTLDVTGVDAGDVGNYQCIVTGGCGSVTSNTAALSLKAATTITQHPTDQPVANGGTAQFSVSATGDGTLTYQWKKDGSNLNDGGHVSGATTPTLTITGADGSDEGSYLCVVTAGCGSEDSNAANLTITGQSCNTPKMDANGDLHVDATDFDAFSACYNGPTNLVSGDCLCMDANGDQYVDATDFDTFSACYNGPANPPGCTE